MICVGEDDLGHKEVCIEDEDKNMNNGVRKSLYKVVDDHFTLDVKVLGSFEVTFIMEIQ